MLFIVVWLVCMIITALVASSKNRSPIAWALLAIPLGLVATVVVACSSKLQEPASPTNHAAGSGSVKTCPRCAETVKAAAMVCRFCQHEFGRGTVEQRITIASQLAWKLEDDWGDGFGVYSYKGQRLAYNKSGVKWQSVTFNTPELAMASVDSHLSN